MSKQDRQGVRKASDLERKYEFGDISKQKEANSKQSIQMNQLSQMVSQFMTTTNGKLTELDYDMQYIEEQLASMKLQIYPVGAVYTSVNNADPSRLFGGTWELLAEGHLLIGLEAESEESLPEILETAPTCYIWQRTN